MSEPRKRIIDPAPEVTTADNQAFKAPSPLSPEGVMSCLVSARDFADMKLPKRPRILDDWLCEGDLGYVFAPRGVGKTWFIMALAGAISQGEPLGAWDRGEAEVPVLYVDGEMPLELTQKRSKGMGLGKGNLTLLHHETLFLQLGTSLNIGRENHREIITRVLIEKGFKCLILDNLSSLASGVEENRGEHYEPISHWLLELRRRSITVIVVHHAGRNAEVMRGHTKREDACSWIVQLSDAKTESDPGAKFISHFAKPSRNTGNPLPNYQWHFTTDNDEVKIHCQLADTSEFETFVQHVLDGVSQQSEIAELMDKQRGTISKWAKKAEAAGHIARKGNQLLPPSKSSRSYTETDSD